MTLPLLLGQEADLTAVKADDLGPVPYFVLGGYLLLLLGLGIYGWIRSRAGEEDYYLAGRGQGWLVSSLTIMATFFSSFALLGAPGMVYREGVVFALFSLNVPVAGLCVYLLGVRIMRAGRAFGFVTPGDMVADYYGSKVALRLLVALTGFLYAIPYVVMQIQAGGVISDKLFPMEQEWSLGPLSIGSFEIGSVLLAAITMLYIMIGGMRSVAWTDLVQGLLLICGMLVGGLAIYLSFDDGQAGDDKSTATAAENEEQDEDEQGNGDEKVDPSFAARVNEKLPNSSLTAPGNTGFWTWTRLLTVCVFGSSGSMVQPAQWMRYFSASSASTLRRGAVIFAVVLTACFILGVMLIGLAGQVKFPLLFTYSEQIEDGPSEIGEVPAELRDHFVYSPPNEKTGAPARVGWKWFGNDVAPLTDDGAETLQALSDNSRFTAAIVDLQDSVERLKESTESRGEGETFDDVVARIKAATADSGRAPKVDVSPNPLVDADSADGKDFDSILVVVLQKVLKNQLGMFGAVFASLMLVAIMAASMSTADSNLHALSAVLTRDVYDQFVHRGAGERERVWVGRAIIVAATLLAIVVVLWSANKGENVKFDFLSMIALMGLAAIAFSAQLLPIAIDILFLRKGTGSGAAAGLAAGLLAAYITGPMFNLTVESLLPAETAAAILAPVKAITGAVPMHGSVWGFLVNVPVFALVSMITRRVPEARKKAYLEAMQTGA